MEKNEDRPLVSISRPKEMLCEINAQNGKMNFLDVGTNNSLNHEADDDD